MKTCTVCRKDQPFTSYHRNKKAVDGLRTYCKTCALDKARKQIADRRATGNYVEVVSKKCSRCRTEKDACEFSINRAKRDGLNAYCKSCAVSIVAKAHKARMLDENYRRQVSIKMKERARRSPELVMWRSARARSKHDGTPFSIAVSDIKIPAQCPVFGVSLCQGDGSQQDNSPSLDKFIPELGYIPGNVQVISWRANKLKRDASPDELVKLAEWALSKLQRRDAV